MYMKRYSILLIIALALAGCNRHNTRTTLTILHSNDTHSQVEPFAKGSSKGDRAGYARRMGLIEKERVADPDLLLLDAGDFSQGTPYFNFFHGRVEVDALNRMQYDAVTLGNHEFDNGVDSLAVILRDAKFDVVCANYEVAGTPLEGVVKPYTILNRKGLRIGIFGIGVAPDNLITPQNFAPLKWLYPLPVANKTAERLRKKEHCDVVVCLSHLGTNQASKDSEICDRWLAENSRNIDVIIGGHTHKVVENLYVKNLDGKDVLLAQMGKSGIHLGKITLTIE